MCLVAASMMAVSARAEVPLDIKGAAVEGGLLFGVTAPGATVQVDGKPHEVAADGHFLIGFGRDAAGTVHIEVRLGSETTRRDIAVADRDFKIERIDGLPQRKVTPDPADIARIGREKAEMDAAKIVRGAQPLYLGSFAWPATGRISGVYGSQRILNGEPRRPHYGTDIAAPEGTPVHALSGGRVTLVHPGMFFNGKTVLIDHGLGLRSVYIHLSETWVKVGDRVAAGDVIGAIGQTGRATGPHLHFGLTLDDTPIDPEVVLGPMPN
jgi:murein DD-endopeptidase MepM/ murein hydrolase activator NlpD